MQFITFELDNYVATITLNRPEVMNALNREMYAELEQAFRDAHRDPEVRCVLLTGAGRGFSAGQDLGDRDPRRGGPPPDLGHTIGTFYNPTIRLIRALPKPVICAVNGVAAGAGANIALACDIVLAASSARFVQSFSKIGLAPDAGGSWHLARRLGEARAMALALTAEPLSARQEDVRITGHAIECRINAEDPRTFVPSPGTITHFHTPGGLGVRVDSGVYSGYRIPPYYDSLIGKLIVHGRNRVECMMRLRRALDEFVVDGIKTTLPLFRDLVGNPDIANGDYDIHWLEKYLAKDASAH